MRFLKTMRNHFGVTKLSPRHGLATFTWIVCLTLGFNAQAAVDDESHSADNDTHDSIEAMENGSVMDFKDGRVRRQFKVLPNQTSDIHPYIFFNEDEAVSETNKVRGECKNAMSKTGKVFTPAIDTTEATEHNPDDPQEPFRLLVEETLTQELNLKKVVIVRQLDQVMGGEDDVYYCLTVENFRRITGVTDYPVITSLENPPGSKTTYKIPTDLPIDKIKMVEVVHPLSGSLSYGSDDPFKTVEAKTIIGLFPEDYKMKGVPGYARPFFIVKPGMEIKSVDDLPPLAYMSKKHIRNSVETPKAKPVSGTMEVSQPVSQGPSTPAPSPVAAPSTPTTAPPALSAGGGSDDKAKQDGHGSTTPTPPSPPLPTPEGTSYMAEVIKRVKNPKLKYAKGQIPVSLSEDRQQGSTLMRFPMRGPATVEVDGKKTTKLLQTGPCGSYHYNPDTYTKTIDGKSVTSPLADSYINPVTACIFSGVLQEWKTDKSAGCPDSDSGCRLSWGNMSHEKYEGRTVQKIRNKKGKVIKTVTLWPHASHTKGTCIDIRLPLKGSHQDRGRDFNDGQYDEAKTRQLVKKLLAWGAKPVIFNDPDFYKGKNALTSYWSGHHDHIHACFPDNEQNKKKCLNDVKISPEVCPELTGDIKKSEWLY